ncbi:fatty acid desaturase [Paraburkholderia caballeronis]|uniref:fatty acid desaturase family protein n=1 Tax=Paraburkholderia caballeronis TaxID=416943 RepID=UPI0010653AD3|nr:fatty acid desaturase [Paraburkholderia caballeronis]TDV37254.1 fatty acid desaturase [Paraburkholderia caballeronis]
MDPEAVVRHDLVRCVPRDVVPARANVALTIVASLALAWLFVGLPLALRTSSHWPAPATWLSLAPVVLATPIHWGLIHEGIHGQLLPSRRANEWAARALAIGIALPFDVMRFGHLMHHRFTREPYDRPDVTDASQSRWSRRLAYYTRLFGGLYAAEVLLPLLAFVPASTAAAMVARSVGARGPFGVQVQRLFSRHAADPERRRRIRRDWLLSMSLHAFALHLYGPWWPVLVVSVYLRGLWLSIADNLPHYGVALDEPGRARDFRVPRGFGVLLMNHHLHRQHHLEPTLPWTALPSLAEEADDAAGKTQSAYFRAAISQFRGLGREDDPRPV